MSLLSRTVKLNIKLSLKLYLHCNKKLLFLILYYVLWNVNGLSIVIIYIYIFLAIKKTICNLLGNLIYKVIYFNFILNVSHTFSDSSQTRTLGRRIWLKQRGIQMWSNARGCGGVICSDLAGVKPNIIDCIFPI